MSMDADRARRLEKWAAGQFNAGPGGYQGATDYPDCPITPKVLGMAAQGLRRLNLGDFLYLCAGNGRADLLRSLADMLDAKDGEGGDALEPHAINDALDSAELARIVRDAEHDGVRTCGELADIKAAAVRNLEQATRIVSQLQAIKPGPINTGEG